MRFNILGTSSHLFWTSGCEGCERSRLSWISQKCLQLFLNFECEVNVKLAVQLVVFALAPAPETEISHGMPLYAGSITRPIARASCRHFECSLASCFLPAAVNR